jgi:hypothetical protein
LLDSGQGLDLRQHNAEKSQLIEKADPIDGISRQKNSLELRPLPLSRRLGRECRVALGKRHGFGCNRKVQFDGQSDETQQPQGVIAKRRIRDDAKDTALEIVESSRDR